MGFPPLHKECAVVCDARLRTGSITFHFDMRSSVPVPHVAINDVTLYVLNGDKRREPLYPVSVLVTRRMLFVVLAYETPLAERVGVKGARIRVERRIRNGAETVEACECVVVSALTIHGEEP